MKPQAKHFPEGTFLNRYMREQEGVETAYVYDLWCGLWLLSLAAGRDIYVNRPRARVWLNLYVTLTAESGVTRKSTAVRIARGIGKKFATAIAKTTAAPEGAVDASVSTIYSEAPVRFVENKSSAEYLLERLQSDSAVFGTSKIALAVDEMVTFFGAEKYARTIPALLTDLYDCPDERDGGGLIKDVRPRILKKVWINILTASTPSWLLRTINPDVIEGGFTSRAMFVWSEERKKPIPWPTERDEDDFAAWLSNIRDKCIHHKTVEIYDAARSFFEKWYRSRHAYRDPFRASFDSREDAHVLRVAALLSINDGSFKINVTHLRYAIRCIDDIKEAGAKLFSGVGAKTNTVIGIDKLRDALVAAGKDALSRHKLLIKVRPYLNADGLTTALDIMHELNMVQRFELKTGEQGRPTTLFRGTKLLHRKGAIDDVMEKMDE